jgi:Zinc knuckle
MPKRVKDELVHLDKPRTLDELRDLIQKIDQRYWECQGEITCETRMAPVIEAKSDKSAQAAPNNDQRQGQNSGNSKPNTNAQPLGKGKEKEKPKGHPLQGQPKKPDLTDKVSKDGKLPQQECQHHQDNNLCLFCGQAGHRVRECPRSTAARAVKASDSRAEG